MWRLVVKVRRPVKDSQGSASHNPLIITLQPTKILRNLGHNVYLSWISSQSHFINALIGNLEVWPRRAPPLVPHNPSRASRHVSRVKVRLTEHHKKTSSSHWTLILHVTPQVEDMLNDLRHKVLHPQQKLSLFANWMRGSQKVVVKLTAQQG